jgi:hypothetical protein
MKFVLNTYINFPLTFQRLLRWNVNNSITCRSLGDVEAGEGSAGPCNVRDAKEKGDTRRAK